MRPFYVKLHKRCYHTLPDFDEFLFFVLVPFQFLKGTFKNPESQKVHDHVIIMCYMKAAISIWHCHCSKDFDLNSY